jgi:hypothetical protein
LEFLFVAKVVIIHGGRFSQMWLWVRYEIQIFDYASIFLAAHWKQHIIEIWGVLLVFLNFGDWKIPKITSISYVWFIKFAFWQHFSSKKKGYLY